MDKVRIGIIGIGGMGSNHAGYISRGEIEGAELCAIADADPTRLEGVQEKFGESVQAFEGADALFAAKCVDAVIVATPHYLTQRPKRSFIIPIHQMELVNPIVSPFFTE